GTGLLDPVPARDAEVEQAVGHVPRDLLGAQDEDLVDAGVGDGGPVLDVGGPRNGKVGGLEQLEGGALQRPLGQHQLEHGYPFGSWRSRSAVSIAVMAASKPLLPALVPARSMACSMVSVVRTPKTQGTPVSSWARWSPAAHWP